MSFGAFPPAIRRRVVVTGVGMVTPLGLDTASTWEALCTGKSGTCALSQVPYFVPMYITEDKTLSAEEKTEWGARIRNAMPCQVAAAVQEVPGGRALTFPPTVHEPRSFRMCSHAVAEAMRDAHLLLSANDGSSHNTLTVQDSSRIGVNIGMGIPSLADVTDVSAHLFGQGPRKVQYNKVNPFFVPKILGNMAAGSTAIRYGLTGPIGSSVAACATGAHCVGEAAAWVREGRADVMVCGATEACITPVSVAGFSRMRALCTKYNSAPHMASRPFDKERGGFIMGEGAGILILEEMDHAMARGAHIYAELRGFGVSCDAHHVAAPHPQGLGARRCIAAALQDSGNVPPELVGHVNAHATGTIGDDIELMALEEGLCARRAVPLHVTGSKGALGHLLGAAGSVEAGVAVLSLEKQLVPPTANLDNPCVTEAQLEKGIVLARGTEPTSITNCEAALSTSFGFGGVNTALLFTRVQ